MGGILNFLQNALVQCKLIHSGGFKKWNSVVLEELNVCSQVESILSAQTVAYITECCLIGDILLYTSVRKKIDFSLLCWYIIDMLIFFILFLKICDFFKLYYSMKFH